MFGDGAFNHKIHYVAIFRRFLFYLERHLKRITGSSVTAILLNGWILHIGGASVVEGLVSTGPTPSSFSVSCIFNRPGVAGAVLQTALSLTH